MHPWALFIYLFLLATVSWTAQSQADLSICNKSIKPAWAAVGFYEDNIWQSKGWWEIKPGDCSSPIAGSLKNRYYYFYANRADDKVWSGNAGQNLFCLHPKNKFNASRTFNCSEIGLVQKPYRLLDAGEQTNYVTNLTIPGEYMPEIKTGNLQEKCLISWDDSHQVHSVRTIVRWDYQAVRTRMKKLRHCIKLTVVGPVDIGGIANNYVKHCTDKALNDSRTLYLVQAIIALGADILGSGGAASAANLYAYIDHVKTTAISCLTDTAGIQSFLEDTLYKKFEATVRNESHWEYWDL